jgi:hypothetical protein
MRLRALVLLAIPALLAGCGSGGSDTTGSSSMGEVENAPAPSPSAFPSAEGKTFGEIIESAKHSKLVTSPAAMVFYKGENRFPFGVFGAEREQVSDAEVALYFVQVPELHPKNHKRKKGEQTQARLKAVEEPAIGPFPASIESLQTKPAFRAATTTGDPDAASVVYASNVDFPANGDWRVAALIKEGGEYSASLMPDVLVGEFHRVPRPGQRPPAIHTPTAADVGGDLSQITTRIPPDTQNKVDFADALGKEPIILLFATPQFCQSRVCGPVVDVAEQVKQVYGDKAAFIHMEIYNENDPAKHVRPQVAAFHLPSEPWLFAIGRDGRVQDVIEGAFGVDALTRVVKQVIAE